jgi:uncharacterized protein (DUF1800 family)
MRRLSLLALIVCTASACAANRKPAFFDKTAPPPDVKTIVHFLNRVTFGPRPADVERVGRIGLTAYLDEQLHPERIPDDAPRSRLEALPGLTISARQFAAEYYAPMEAARKELTATQKPPQGTAKLSILRGHLLPVVALTLPGGDKPVRVLQQAPLTPEEVLFDRENQDVFNTLQAQKLLRAVYSDRQLEEVLVDFWFNHFNVDARKIEDRPVVAEYEREVIRPHVLGKFRDLLGATAKSPAMLFYLDNWMSAGPPQAPRPGPGRPAPPKTPARPPAGRGLNENYGRELLELHTLGVDGGYTQKDVVEVARAFTGWTMKNPRDGTGFLFDDRKHDHGEKHVLGHRIKAGRGIEDGEQVLDILARHPATARFIATKLVRRFVADDPPQQLIDRAAKTFTRTGGDLREVMRTVLTAPELFAPATYRAKVKTPFEFIASALRATNAEVTNVRAFVGVIGTLGEPLYQCQPPTGYSDRSAVWLNTGTLVARLNFAVAFAANGLNAAKLATIDDEALKVLASATLAGDLSAETRRALDATARPPNIRGGLLLGSPEFQRR